MKSNEDYRSSIDLKANKIIHKRKRRNRFVASAASAAACLSLIICAVMLMPGLINSNPVVENSGNPTGTGTDQSGQNTKPENPGSISDVYMNKISDYSRAERLYFDPKKTYREIWNWEQIVAYLGKDITPAYITGGLKSNLKFKEQTVIFNNDGTIAYDAIWLEYYTEYCDDGSQSIGRDAVGIRIVASKAGYSRDCVYVWPSDMKETLLNGVYVKFGYRKMEWGGTAENPESYYDLFVAEFTKDNISYQVISSNLNENEFVKMVDSLTQQ